MHDSHTRVPDTYFPVLPACESRLVMHFYKSNVASAKVARNPILHHVIISNKQCVLATRLPKPYETTFLLV